MNELKIALLAWFIAEGCGLMQIFVWFIKKNGYPYNRLKPFDCPLCLAFWIGLFYTLNPMSAVICSCMAILISKIYTRL